MTTEHLSETSLVSWALDELSSAESLAAAAHLEQCARCRGEANGLQELCLAYRENLTEPPPHALLMDLLTAQASLATRTQSAPLAPFRRTVRVALAAAAIVFLFLSGYWVGQRATGDEEPLRVFPADRAPDAVPAVGADPGVSRRLPLPEPPAVRFAAIPSTGI